MAGIVSLALHPQLGEEMRQILADAIGAHPEHLAALLSLANNQEAGADSLAKVATAVARRQTIDITRHGSPTQQAILALPESVRLVVALAQQAFDFERMGFFGRNRSGWYQLALAPSSHAQLFAQGLGLAAPLANREERERLVREGLNLWKPKFDDIAGIGHADSAVRLPALQQALSRMQLHPVIQRLADGGPRAELGAEGGVPRRNIAVAVRAARQQWVLDVAVMFGGLSGDALSGIASTLQSLDRLRAPTLREVLTERLALDVHGGSASAYSHFASLSHRPHMPCMAVALHPLFLEDGVSRPLSDRLRSALAASDLKNARLLTGALKDLISIADVESGLSKAQRRSLLERSVPDFDSASQRCKGFLANLRLLAIAVQAAKEGSPACNALSSIAESDDMFPDIAALLTPLVRSEMPGAGAQDNRPDDEVRWQRFFQSWRQPGALIAYAQNLRAHLDDGKGSTEVLQALDRFADSAVWSDDGRESFRKLRYDASGSPHLKRIAEQAPQAYIRWQESASLNESAAAHEAVEDTDDPEDLLLCGTEVSSCQRVDGDASKNKALMGYVLDGKYRMLAHKDHNGAIVARRMLRLLVDETSGRPVLHIDKFYANAGIDAGGSVDAALLRLAVAKAAGMHCAVVCNADDLQDAAPQPAFSSQPKSYGSPVPFEYVDAEYSVRGGDESDTESGSEDGDLEPGVVGGGVYRLTDVSPLP